MTLLITGNTYPHKRHLRGAGAIFDYERKGYVADSSERIKKICDHFGLEYQEIEELKVDEDFEVLQKNNRAQKRAEKYDRLAESTQVKADNTELAQHEKNFLSLGEPIKVGHHSEKRHRKLIDKARKTADKKVELYDKADNYQSKAEYRRDQKYLTTAQKAEKKKIEKELEAKAIALRKKDHKVGDIYYGHKQFEIQKINKITVTSPTGSNREIKYSRDYAQYLKMATTS